MKKKQIVPDAQTVPDTSPFIDTEYCGDVDFLLAQCKDRFDTYSVSRNLVDPYFYQNLAFFSGRHYMQWNNALSCLDPVLPVNPLYTQAVSNLILPHVRALISKKIKNKPNAQVLPNSGSDDDRLSARASRSLLRHNYFNNGYAQEYAEAAAHTTIEGIGALKTKWDHYGGKAYCKYEMEPKMMDIQMEAEQEGVSPDAELDDYLRDPGAEEEENGQKPEPADGGSLEEAQPETAPQDGQTPQPSPEAGDGDTGQANGYVTKQIPVLDENNKPVMVPKMNNGKPVILDQWFEGKVIKRACSPFGLFYDLTVRKFSELFDVIEVNYHTLDYVRNNIPNCEDLTEADCEQQAVSPWENIFSMQIDRSTMQTKTGFRVYEFVCKSCEEFPLGLEVIWVKDKVRCAGPMDTIEGEELNYSFAKEIILPGALRGMSVIEFLIGPQTLRNKLLSQHVENAKLAETYRIILPQGTRFNDSVTTDTGIILSVTGPGEPHIMNMPQLPSTHMQLIELMKTDMDFIAMQAESSFGFIPPNITSGDMLEGANMAGAEAHQTEKDDFDRMVAHSCHLELMYEQKNRKGDIMIRYLGENGRLETDKFKAALIRNNVDVIVQPGDMGDESRQSQEKKLEMLLPIVTQGKGSPEQQNLIITKALDSISQGEEDFLVTQINVDLNAVRLVIDQIKENNGNPDFDPKPMGYDDLPTWREELRRKLADRGEMMRWDPKARDMLMNLYLFVDQKLDSLMNPAQNTQQVPPTPGAPQPPAPPGIHPAQGPPSPVPTGAPQ